MFYDVIILNHLEIANIESNNPILPPTTTVCTHVLLSGRYFDNFLKVIHHERPIVRTNKVRCSTVCLFEPFLLDLGEGLLHLHLISLSSPFLKIIFNWLAYLHTNRRMTPPWIVKEQTRCTLTPQ